MHDGQLEAASPDLVRAALHVSIGSIVWTVCASALAIAIGVSRGNLVLVAFGLTGAFDAAASVALVLHFRHALHHEAFSDTRERLAERVVMVGLLGVGAATAAESARRLVEQSAAMPAVAGIVIAGLSAFALGALAWRKHRVAALLSSRGLHADARLSGVGCLLAVVTVAGTGLNAALGWWWLDPAAALAVALGAIGTGIALRRS